MKHLLPLILILALLLTGCGSGSPAPTAAPSPTAAAPSPTPTPPGTTAPSDGEPQAAQGITIPAEPYSRLSFENDWFTLRDAYSDAVAAYGEYREFKLDDGSILLIEPKETLTDVSFFSTDMDSDGSYVPGEVFYSLEELTPEEPLVLEVQFYGDMTAYGMSFTDAAGQTHRLLLTMGGRDADEACPYSMTEF